MDRRRISIAVTFAVGILSTVSAIFAGCATIVNGRDQAIGIISTPTGASIIIDNKTHGNTPTVAYLRRKETHRVRIELRGYEPYETVITRKVSGWIWGNIAAGGLIGLAVDAITGSLYRLTPEDVMASLRKGHAEVDIHNEVIYFAVVLQPNPKWEKVGALTRL